MADNNLKSFENDLNELNKSIYVSLSSFNKDENISLKNQKGETITVSQSLLDDVRPLVKQENIKEGKYQVDFKNSSESNPTPIPISNENEENIENKVVEVNKIFSIDEPIIKHFTGDDNHGSHGNFKYLI